MHGGDVNNTHTSMTCHNPGPSHNPKCDKDKYDGRQHGGPTQDDPAFCFRSHPTCPMSAMRPRSYDVAATPASREFYSNDGGDAYDDADDPLPGHQLHGPPVRTSPSTVWTSPPCCCAACAPSRTACRNDDAVLQSLPTTSKLLMVRGEQS
jgi:hypothetical protein